MIYLIDFLLIYILFIKSKAQIINRYYIENPILYKNEICSYNGNPISIITGNTAHIECDCFPSYVDEPREDHKKYIGDQFVHCSYKRKKRFTTFFLAGLIPMGFDYFYLGYHLYFAIIFFFFILIVTSQIICLLLSYKLKEMFEESKNEYNERNDNSNRNFTGLNSNQKRGKEEQLKKCLNVYRIINKILIFMMVFYWISDAILQARGIIKDKNGIETENDMNSLFSREET